MTKIITIANRKGGVSKTSICHNLGAIADFSGLKTLFLDLDSQGNLCQLCGIDLINLENWKALNIRNVFNNLDILPASKMFNQLEHEITSQIDRNNYLKKLLNKIKDNYDIILIDTPPAFSMLNLNALFCSDLLVIPVNPDGFSISGLGEMKVIFQEVKEINNNLDYKIILSGIIKNRDLFRDLKPILKKDSGYIDIEIPYREYFKKCSLEKKPVIDNKELFDIFQNIFNEITGVKNYA